MASQTTTALQPPNVFTSKPTAPLLSSPSKPTEQRLRPYKDFLTPALHRRFTQAAILTLATCYLNSILIAPPSLLWIWNPLSSTGIRAILLFLPCLAVFIVRVANMHVGQLATTSAVESIWRMARDWKTAHTLAWYVWSAWFFGEVYLWSQSERAHLGWVDPGRSFGGGLEERPVLNENPIFLRSVWVSLAVGQAIVHLARGDDGLAIPAREGERKVKVASKLPEPLQELVDRLPTVLGRTIRLLIPGAVLTFPIYHIFIRNAVWSYFSAIAGIFYRQLSHESQPTGLQHHLQLAFHTITSAFLLISLWELSSAVFTIYVSQPPLRREQPLTTEMKDAQGNVVSKSKDPNGSLLSGLKSRKEVPKAFAFWELWIICEKFEARRKTIYTEVDRKDGSTWAQVSKLCLDEMEGMERRIQESLSPRPEPINPPLAFQQPTPPQPLGLPKIADRQVQDADVFQRQNRSDFSHQVAAVAKSIGQSPNSAQAMQVRARKAIEWSTDRVLTKTEQQHLSRASLAQDANSSMLQFLSSPVGEPFRQTFSRRMRAIVFGAPHNNSTNILHASQALSILCVNSLKEDDYGQVARSIPIVLRTYTATICAVTSFVASLPPHWTDVEFSEPRGRRVQEVEEVLDVLKAGLEGVLLAFAEYADAVGVTRKELREAREALGKGLEMREAR